MKKSDDQWKQQLEKEVYWVARQQGTEEAFSGDYYLNNEPGIYNCICCNATLFSSLHKYDSASGWPSFWQSVNDHCLEMNHMVYSALKFVVLPVKPIWVMFSMMGRRPWDYAIVLRASLLIDLRELKRATARRKPQRNGYSITKVCNARGHKQLIEVPLILFALILKRRRLIMSS